MFLADELITETIAAAVGDNELVVKVKVKLPINGDVITKFSSHVLSAKDLIERSGFKVHIHKRHGDTAAFLSHSGSSEVVLESSISNWFFSIVKKDRPCKALKTVKERVSREASLKHCQERLGHSSPERFAELSSELDVVPRFTNQEMRRAGMHCLQTSQNILRFH